MIIISKIFILTFHSEVSISGKFWETMIFTGTRPLRCSILNMWRPTSNFPGFGTLPGMLGSNMKKYLK